MHHANLLRATSRSFYLTLRILPGAIRRPIGLAYLLARTTDTIADTEVVPLAQRLTALRKLRERILDPNAETLDLAALARQQGTPLERALLENAEQSLLSLDRLPPDQLQLVRAVLDTITHGQELDLHRFSPSACRFPEGGGPESTRPVIALGTDSELDDYTYRVAGCVGEFWTRLCRARLFPRARLDDGQLLAEGVRFGKGLQLVNILRDVPADLRQGRCYVPAQKLAEAGLAPADLLQPANEPRFRPLYHRYLAAAQSHLAAGWSYTNRLPRRQMRVRLACAWPILIGVQTLVRLRAANVLDPRRRIKVSRAEVRGLLWRSLLAYPLPGAWRNLFEQAGKAVAPGGKLS